MRVFKCCTDDEGEYCGSKLIHDPDIPGDGPWYVAIKSGDKHRYENGFGTKEQALAFVTELTEALKNPEIETWD